VLGEHLVEDWRDVHGVGVQSACSCGMTMLPAGVPCWSFASQPMTYQGTCLTPDSPGVSRQSAFTLVCPFRTTT
jgi:hypothetical protein